MHRSHWDLEVYARDFQERRWQEAARSRLSAQAAGTAQRPSFGTPFSLTIAGILGAWRSRLAFGRAAAAPQSIADSGPIPAADVAPRPLRAARGRLVQPYADMVVVARGSMAGVTEQPCGVSDC